jgi:hypothetical protein
MSGYPAAAIIAACSRLDRDARQSLIAARYMPLY